MELTDPTGQQWLVRRRWWPWRLRRQPEEPALLPTEVAELGLLLLLLPLVIVLRTSRVARWPIEVWRGDDVAHTESVRGWRRSRDRMLELGDDVLRGVPPHSARRLDDGGATA